MPVSVKRLEKAWQALQHLHLAVQALHAELDRRKFKLIVHQPHHDRRHSVVDLGALLGQLSQA